jgi:hypothetical protein
MKQAYTVISDTAVCENCGKKFTCTKNAQALAKQHAEKYGHRVTGEKEVLYMYDGRDKQ